jgi:RNA-directed DNA polymerase
MARKHVNKRVVISVDIKDFFHSIKQHSLMSMFTDYGFGEKPARTLSELCTYKAFVPQGAITSPKISNIISARTFGPLIRSYCEGLGLTLTIYADDITISWDQPEVQVSQVLQNITHAVTQFGFRINTKKTKVMRRHNRQYVCGVVVNDKTNLMKKERLKLRAIVHNLLLNGPEHEALKTQSSVDHFINVLRGRLNWFRQLNSVQGERLFNKFNEALETHKEALQNLVSEIVGSEPVSTTGDIASELPPPFELVGNKQEEVPAV